MDGQTVQLVGGREKAIDAGDPVPIARKFRLAGEIALIDLNAAIGNGSNAGLVEKVLSVAPCRVGGGIRSVETAVRWLDAGAAKVILGTAATPEILGALPRERVIAALDAQSDDVVVEGWRKKTGRKVVDRMRELRGMAGGFLVTFVEREGRLGGIDMERVKELAAEAGDAKLTIAGGVTTTDEIAACDRLGVDAQVGMAIYTGKMELADAIAAPMVSDRLDGLWPTVVADERGMALGLAYSSIESLREAVRTRSGVYHSRKRGLWRKGGSSGDTQELLRVDPDCDRDTLRFTVRQSGRGFCHNGTTTCWGQGRGLAALGRTVSDRIKDAPPESYTARLVSDSGLLKAKLIEEARELADADNAAETAHEAADVIYFTMVAMAKAGVNLEDVEAVLDSRALKVTRRPGNAKG
jgi:phosphoribosyl-ATP pyrophosphohydrolase